MKRTVLATAVLGTMLAAAVPVFAQGGPEGGPGGPGPRFERMCENLDARVAGMLAFAETRLKITDAQRAAWDNFAQAVKNSEGPMKQRCENPEAFTRPATLPERAQRMEEMMTARLEQVRQIRPALDQLYAGFSDEQKKTADEMMERMMRHGPGGFGEFGHGPRHRHGHGHDHGDGPRGERGRM
ncbi:Spy/CpxP family protein refolding chaperone [Skermanella sp. TT6]|uniref:Spy/CpxP family protein refolding chaperone n=1 Tax=Skermanella cutis TaxID=2775420 RepID=A0ABX7AZV2_9PROT|nr:Spy/CpxP family protein refolding chaperone [Skermanella sp. TT6]QQP87397.1 Spy/CpxP family protein refolding chaperone [Skermanella sp. TT6]